MTGLPPHIPDIASYKVPPVLLPYQRCWMADASLLKVIGKNRHTGTTWTEAPDNVLTIASSVPAGGMNVYYTTYNQDMTVEYTWVYVMRARASNHTASEIEGRPREEDDNGKHIRTYTIRFPDSDFRVVALSSRPSNLYGRQGIIVIDKAAFHEQLGELPEAALAMLIWGGKVRVISTHGGDDSPFNMFIGDIRAGRQGGNVHRITFREAMSEGLLRRVCLHAKKEWSETPKQAWMASVYEFYGAGAFEELDCTPASGGDAWLSRTLIEPRMSANMLVLRLTCEEGYELLSDKVCFREMQDWLGEYPKPLLEALPADAHSLLRHGFGRNGDLSVDYPLLQEKNLIRRVPFVLELRNVSFRQQEQIIWYLIDGLSGLLGAAFDARGNNTYLAEYVMQHYGFGRVQQMMSTEGWYRGHVPPIKTAPEDDNLVNLPKDEDALDDLWVVQAVNSVPCMPEQRPKIKTDGGKRHRDSAIALTLAYFTSREVNKGPVRASSHRCRQATHILEGF